MDHESLTNKLKELTEDELKMVIGGGGFHYKNEVGTLDSCHFNPSRFSGGGEQICGGCSHCYELGCSDYCELIER